MPVLTAAPNAVAIVPVILVEDDGPSWPPLVKSVVFVAALCAPWAALIAVLG